MMGKWSAVLKSWFAAAGRRRLLVAVGVLGIALLALSELLPRREPASPDGMAPMVTAQAVEQALEERMTTLLSAVEGVGACQVMVTLENTAQAVYAANTATQTATGTDGSENLSSEETLLMVETDTGPVGLPVTELQPTVKGVAVACRGGDDPAVCQRVIDLVTTAFHISDRRVCVVKQQ